MQYALPVEAPQRSAGSVCRRKKPSETKFTKTDCCFFANKRYLCPRKEVAPPSKDSVVRATHAKAGVQSGADDRFSGRNTNRFPQGSSNGGMVDTKDLKSFGHCGCAGSSPASSTESHAEHSAWLSCFYSSESLLLLCIINLLNNRVYKDTNYQSLPFVFYFISYVSGKNPD